MSSLLKSVSAVRIFTRNLAQARRFYADVLGLEQQAVASEYVVFDLAGVAIVVEQVASDEPEGDDLVGRLVSASFRVEDIDATYRHLSAQGVSFVQAPEKQPWGGTLAFARDPDSNVITLVG